MARTASKNRLKYAVAGVGESVTSARRKFETLSKSAANAGFEIPSSGQIMEALSTAENLLLAVVE